MGDIFCCTVNIIGAFVFLCEKKQNVKNLEDNIEGHVYDFKLEGRPTQGIKGINHKGK